MRKTAAIKIKFSKASLILGILGLFAWVLPVLGAVITILGLVLGIKSHKSIKKDLATIGIVLCVIGFLLATTNFSIGAYRDATSQAYNSSDGVTFCQNVDKNLNAINASTTFPSGDVYVRIKTSSVFDTTKLKVTLYKIDGMKENVFDSVEQVVNQNWFVIAVPITFEETGTYKIVFTKLTDGKELGQGTVTIK